MSAKRPPRAALLLAAAFVLGFLCQYRPVWDMDSDLWLAAGRWILAHGVPATDPLSYTAGDRSWIDHEWAFQVVQAWLVDLGGIEAVKVFCAGLVGLGCAGLALGFRRRGLGAAGTLAALALLLYLYEPRLRNRPHLVSFVGASLLFAVPLTRLAVPRLLALLPFWLFWVNAHAGWVLGPVHAGTILVLALARREPGAWRRPAALLGALLLASLANPYGLRLVLSPLRISEVRDLIPEWQSVFVLGGEHSLRAVLSATLAAATLAAVVLALRRRDRQALDPDDAAPALYGQAFGPTSLRFVHLQALALPLVAGLVPRRPVLPLCALVAALLLLGADQGRRWVTLTRMEGGPGRAYVAGRFPEQELAWMRDEGLHGRLLCPPRWSGHALVTLGEGTTVAIDGRLELHGRKAAEWTHSTFMGFEDVPPPFALPDLVLWPIPLEGVTWLDEGYVEVLRGPLARVFRRR